MEELEVQDLRENYFRVSNHIYDQELDVYEIGVYSCLCRFAHNESTESFPSITTIEKMLQISRNRVIKSLKALVKYKIIHKKSGHTGKSNRYYLLDIPSARGELVRRMNQGSAPHEPPSASGELGVVHEVNSKKTHVKRLTKKTKEKNMPVLPTSLKACEEFAPAWETWLTYRKEMRKTVTPTMAAGMLSKMEKMGPARAVAMIRHTIENGWQGLYEAKGGAKTDKYRENYFKTKELLKEQEKKNERKAIK